MKTTDEQIEKMARDISHLEISDTLIESLHNKEIDELRSLLEQQYKAGFKACEAKMLAEASDGFDQWWDNERGGKPLNNDHIPVTEQQLYKWEKEAYTAGAMLQARKLNEDYELGKELSHEDLFRLLKHQQKSAEINLGLYNKSQKEIQKLKEENETLLHDMKMLWRNSRSNYVSPLEREVVQEIKHKYRLKHGGEK
jgi:hypothetical protein